MKGMIGHAVCPQPQAVTKAKAKRFAGFGEGYEDLLSAGTGKWNATVAISRPT
jgi:hypothetical protein